MKLKNIINEENIWPDLKEEIDKDVEFTNLRTHKESKKGFLTMIKPRTEYHLLQNTEIIGAIDLISNLEKSSKRKIEVLEFCHEKNSVILYFDLYRKELFGFLVVEKGKVKVREL